MGQRNGPDLGGVRCLGKAAVIPPRTGPSRVKDSSSRKVLMQLRLAVLLLLLVGEIHRDQLQHGALCKPDHGSPKLGIGEACRHALRHVPRCLDRE